MAVRGPCSLYTSSIGLISQLSSYLLESDDLPPLQCIGSSDPALGMFVSSGGPNICEIVAIRHLGLRNSGMKQQGGSVAHMD